MATLPTVDASTLRRDWLQPDDTTYSNLLSGPLGILVAGTIEEMPGIDELRQALNDGTSTLRTLGHQILSFTFVGLTLGIRRGADGTSPAGRCWLIQ